MAVAALAQRPYGQGLAAVVEALAARFGDRFSTAEGLRDQHANSLTWHRAELPDAVAFPLDTPEVQEIVRVCAENRVPIIPYGTGTSLEGHINAPYGGVTVDLSRMNQVLAVNPEDLDCVVEAGVTRKQLNEHLRDVGLFFPIDPGADASLGGMASTRASGTNAVRYGTMRENVINLTAVMPDGRAVRTARRAKKTSAGYDLTRLMVGSEGTLGIITELTLRLHGIPQAVSAGVCAFESVEGACNATIMTIQSGIPVARIELLDELQIRMCNLYSKLSLPERPTLFVEFHGTDSGVAEQAAIFAEIAADCGGGEVAWATQAEERSRLWQARHDVYWAVRSYRPGWDKLSTDVCVPISRLAECVLESRADLDAMDLLGSIVGHVGDGNFHVALMFDRDDADHVARVKLFLEGLALRAIAMDGTCTGEHGVGQGKIAYLEAELGSALDVMRQVKRALDPHNIMNPGKVLTV